MDGLLVVQGPVQHEVQCQKQKEQAKVQFFIAVVPFLLLLDVLVQLVLLDDVLLSLQKHF